MCGCTIRVWVCLCTCVWGGVLTYPCWLHVFECVNMYLCASHVCVCVCVCVCVQVCVYTWPCSVPGRWFTGCRAEEADAELSL